MVLFHIFADNELGDLVRNNCLTEDGFVNDGYCCFERSFFDDFALYRSLRKIWYVLTGNLLGLNGPVSSDGDNNKCAFARTQQRGSFVKKMMARAKADAELNESGFRQVYMNDRYDIEFACKLDNFSTAYAAKALKRLVIEMDKIKSEKGLDVIYIVQLSEDDTTDNHPSRTDGGCDDYDPSNLTDFFMDILPRTSAINLFEDFLNCKECFFTEDEFGEDNHWSATGVESAAEKILKSGLLPV